MKVRQYKDYIEITGYVISTQRYSKELCENGKKFYEKVAENVFARAIDKARNIEKREIQFFFNHDSNKLLGHTGENVQLIEDAVGLKITAKIEKSNPNYEEILNNISLNRLTGFSFGFIPLKQNWEDDKHVTVEDMKLLEVSLLNVTPAYNGTVVETRDKDGEQIHLRYGEGVDEMEELLKELIAEVKSLKEVILEDKEDKEDKEEDKEEPKEDKTEDETEDKVEPKEEKEEVEPKEEPKEDEEKENKEDDKEDKKQEEPVDDKEEPKEKEDEEKKRALIQSQLDSLR